VVSDLVAVDAEHLRHPLEVGDPSSASAIARLAKLRPDRADRAGSTSCQPSRRVQGRANTAPCSSLTARTRSGELVTKIVSDTNTLENVFAEAALIFTSQALTYTQFRARVGNRRNRKPRAYAGFVNPCNAQLPLTAHSQ
jgi:hypothetical protein